MKKTDSLFAKKSLGQNFLMDQRVLARMVEHANLSKEDTVVEIGPGKGALTAKVLPHVKKIIAIEKDERFIELLREQFNEADFEIIQADILKFPFDQIPTGVKLIGNLPYNIASPIVERLLENRHLFSDIYITVQLEHGRRMAAKVNEEDYSSFSCFVQYYSNPKILFTIHPGAFSPAPKVQSCFMRLSFPTLIKERAKNEGLLFKVIRQAFNQRRKTLENSLEVLMPKTILREICRRNGLNEKLRAENISLENYIRITNDFAALESSRD